MSSTKVGVSEQQMAERRRAKIQELRDKGIDPYPVSFPGREKISQAIGTASGHKVKIAGRIIGKRDLSKITFLDVEDQTGMIELHIQDHLKDEFVDCSLGDLVGIDGFKSINQRKAPIILVNDLILLAKAIRDPPDKVHGLNDDEFRFRHREVEMLSSREVRSIFIQRAKVIKVIRSSLDRQGFIEVETPVLQPIYGGATAKPFVTSHNALAKTSYLRISSELYLKRYLVGGLDKVYHIGKSFRNEGISTEHSPEFSMVEFFATCMNYKDMAYVTEDVLSDIWKYFDLDNDFKFDWDLPAKDWPLSRRKSGEPDKAEAWELYADGMEIASGASDLNNPDEQKERLLEGSAVKVFTEANPYDQTYIESLEYGLLPVAGVGIGIDRLMMLIAGKKNIREVIAFPAMR